MPMLLLQLLVLPALDGLDGLPLTGSLLCWLDLGLVWPNPYPPMPHAVAATSSFPCFEAGWMYSLIEASPVDLDLHLLAPCPYPCSCSCLLLLPFPCFLDGPDDLS
jgi:hypothetical protein